MDDHVAILSAPAEKAEIGARLGVLTRLIDLAMRIALAIGLAIVFAVGFVLVLLITIAAADPASTSGGGRAVTTHSSR